MNDRMGYEGRVLVHENGEVKWGELLEAYLYPSEHLLRNGLWADQSDEINGLDISEPNGLKFG